VAKHTSLVYPFYLSLDMALFLLAVARLRLLALALLAFTISVNAREESLCAFAVANLHIH
jgi:hypothetical protein